MLSNGSVKKMHVVLNECNVFNTFFDPKIPIDTFGNNDLSPLVRLCEALCQNNECPVESIISIFSSQAFRGQHEDTAENRAIIKINGDTIGGAEDFCTVLSEMSTTGVPEWGIDQLTLPIKYGRYASNPIAKAFARIQSKKGSKFDYMYKCKGENFSQRMSQIGNSFREVQMKFNANDSQNS